MTLSELEADCYRRLGFNSSSPDTATQTRLRAFLNETQQEILSEPGMASLLNGSLTFASVASTATYSLPPAAVRVKALYETTNDRRLTERSLDWYRSVLPDVSAITGTPVDYVDLGYTSIDTQPSAATELFVDSTAAGDTGTAYLEGYRTGGYFRSDTVTMTGTTGVTFDSTITDWLFLTKFYLSTAAVGTVTLQTTIGGGTTLATIPIGQTYARYRRIALVPTPASAITYTVDFDWDAQNMAIATDEPLIPVRFHRILGLGARAKEYEKQNDERFAITHAAFQKAVRQMKFFLLSDAAGQPNLRGQRVSGYSRLGGQYPAGT